MMDKQSIFFSILTGIVSTALMLLAIKALGKKLNLKSNDNPSSGVTYGIWSSSLLISFLLLLKPALTLIENSIEIIIFSKTIETTFLTVMEKISISIGFTFIVTFMLYYISGSLIKLLYGTRLDSIEMERQNNAYFLLKGVLLIFLVYAILPMFEHFINWFAPVIETPFYR